MKIHRILHFLLSCLALVPAQAADRPQEEVIVQVRFRGNFTIPDETMIRLGGIQVGIPIAPSPPDDLKRRLLQTGRFEWVEVTKRYRSLQTTGQVVLVITVKEKEPFKSKFMFMPILSGSDEYGLSYGGRITSKDLLGFEERLSVPLTWGGVKRAALEGEFELHNPVISTIAAGFGISQRENPHYGIDDSRIGIQGSLRRRVNRFEFSLQSGWTGVDFGVQNSSFVKLGAGLVFDTRQDISFPRDSVYAGIGWERLAFLGEGPGLNLYTLDLRGYKKIFGQTVLAGQFRYRGADGRLPDFERPFLGGADTLRGHEPGAYIGDNIAVSSIELRVPLTSPRAVHRAGIELFLDSGTVYDYGMPLKHAKFRHGSGLGCFLMVAGFGIRLDVAYNMHDAFVLHFGTRFRF